MLKWCIRLVVVFLAGGSPIFGGVGEVDFVEAAVDLKKDGSAVVAYTVGWNVTGGSMGGFYFSGNENLKIEKFASESYAIDSTGRRHSLEITLLREDYYDILLADGARGSEGPLSYVFYFAANFSDAGYLSKTVSDEFGELVVFNWSPVQWGEAYHQKSYTLKILTPYVLPSGLKNIREYVYENKLILTEPYVNDKYVIDYRRGASG